jgi:thiol-disulfide isomerase/thioredoxin
MKIHIALMLILLVAATTFTAAKTPGEVEVGGTLRDATMQGLSGPARKLSEFRGKPLIIAVWASWCGPCREEMGSLERLSRHYGGGPFVVIGISTDDDSTAAKAFLRRSKTTFSNFIDSQLMMENMLGADRIPLTLLIDAQGRVLKKFYGTEQWDSPDALDVIRKTFRIQL